MPVLVVFLLFATAPRWNANLQQARDAQNAVELTRLADQFSAIAERQPKDPDAQYRAAMAQSTRAEVATELRDKTVARAAAEAGMKAAEAAIALNPKNAEFHRILGTLCGQEAAAVGGLGALKYGHCALEEVNKALELDPKAALNYLSRGVGNYYLPSALGGGIDLAIQDFEKAIALDARSADAQLWLGLALRKAHRDAEARKAFEKAVQLNPARVWARQQLAKTPAD